MRTHSVPYMERVIPLCSPFFPRSEAVSNPRRRCDSASPGWFSLEKNPFFQEATGTKAKPKTILKIYHSICGRNKIILSLKSFSYLILFTLLADRSEINPLLICRAITEAHPSSQLMVPSLALLNFHSHREAKI